MTFPCLSHPALVYFCWAFTEAVPLSSIIAALKTRLSQPTEAELGCAPRALLMRSSI